MSGFVITVMFELQDGAFADFHSLIRENAAASVKLEPDCSRFDVLVPDDGDRSRVLVYEIYSSRAAFDLHLASAHFRQFDERSRPLVRAKTVAAYAVEENAKRS